ncbi:MAG: translocation/assembly module TamB domain-containing protein [Bacteroidales bacterium]|nr:translocation/assembly module TamB domain-containing protein [Bacteroidales bacterium]
MRKFLRILLWLLALVVVLLIGTAIALQSSAVQTFATRKAIGLVADKIDGTVHIEKIHLRPFNALVIKNIDIIDNHPYMAQADTFFHAEYITATFSLRGLFEGKGMQMGSARVQNGSLTLTIEPDDTTTTTNLSRIFRLKSDDEPPVPNDTQYFEIDRVEVDGFRYRMLHYAPSMDIPDDAIDWFDLDVYDIQVRGRKLGMRGIVMYGIADEVSFKEKSGYQCYHLSGSTRVGEQKTIVSDLRLRDPWSDINLKEYRMSYAGTPSFADYINAVRMDAELLPSRVSMRTIGYFAPQIKFMTAIANISSGGFHGYVNDFTLDHIKLKALDSGLSATVDGRMTGIPDDMAIDFRLADSRFTAGQLGRFLSSISPARLDFSQLAPGQTFRLDASARGPLNNIAIRGTAQAPSGSATTRMNLRNIRSDEDITLDGSLTSNGLDLGGLLGMPALGALDMRSEVGLRLADSGPELRLDSLSVHRIGALGYDYRNLTGHFSYGARGISGHLYGDDPNLLFVLDASTRDGRYVLDGEVGYVDLNELGIDKRGTSRLSFAVDGDVLLDDDKGFDGRVLLKDVLIEDRFGLHDIGDIDLRGNKNALSSEITLHSGVADGHYSGSAFVDTFLADLKGLTLQEELPALTGEERRPYSGNRYHLDLAMHDSRDLLSYVMPGLYIADSTRLQLDVTPQARLSGTLSSRRMAMQDKYLKNIFLQLSNRYDSLTGEVDVDEIRAGAFRLQRNHLVAYAQDNELGLGYSYENDTELTNKGELFLNAVLDRPQPDSLAVLAEVLPCAITFNGDAWRIHPALFSYMNGHIAVDSLLVSSAAQSLRLDGGYSKTRRDTLRLDLNAFDIGMLNHLMSMDLDIHGLATGGARLTSPFAAGDGLLLNLRIDSTRIAGEPAGTVRAQTLWDAEQNGFSLSLGNTLNGRNNLRAEGLYVPKDNRLQLLARLDSLNAGYARPILSSVFSDLSGSLSGTLSASGPLDALELSSDGLRIDEGILRVGYTNVPYRAQGPVHVDSRGLWFDDVRLSDGQDGTGQVTGSIGWDHFRNMTFDTHVAFDEMQVLALEEGQNPLFYGHAYGSGVVDITGPMSLIGLSVDASTRKEGDFHLPLSRSDMAGPSNLLTFKQPEVQVYIDPYEALMNQFRQEVEDSPVNLDIKLKLNVTPTTEAFIEVDKASGNVLTGRGRGVLEIDVVPAKDIFSMNGNYEISSGKYHLDVMNLAQKDFHIQDGSSIKFNGNVMDSELDIRALYKLKASIGTLIADSTSTTRRNVECGLHITDRLSGPRVGFSIDIPDLDPITQVQVSAALGSEDKVQKQFLSLLISGSFLPDEASGIVNNTSMLNTTLSEIMAGQLNSIMQKLDLPIDFGLDYQTNSAGKSVYDVAVSTQLFNNRVIVNGTIGNRRNTAQTSEVVGDLDIEIKLDKSGALRLVLFSHSADQYTSYLDNSQRNGLGLTYQREFSNFKDLMTRLFAGRKKRDAAELERQRRLQNEEKVQIHIEQDDKR